MICNEVGSEKKSQIEGKQHDKVLFRQKRFFYCSDSCNFLKLC